VEIGKADCLNWKNLRKFLLGLAATVFRLFHLFSLRGPEVAWPRKFDQMLVGFLFGQQLREHHPGVLQMGAIDQVANRFAQKQSADFVRAF